MGTDHPEQRTQRTQREQSHGAGRHGAAVRTPAVHVADTLAYLAGTWSVERELSDSSAAGTGHFTGTAAFRQLPDGHWLHEEEGVLEWHGIRRDATRTLRLTRHADGTADVAFADGRPFHQLDLRGGAWTAVHLCGRDRYEGAFTLVSADTWQLRWRVTGPAKDQVLASTYRRA